MPKSDKKIDSVTRKNIGAHYTPSLLATFVAKKILDKYESISSKKNILKVLDPAVGDGELLYAIIEEAFKRKIKKIEVTGFDIDINAVNASSLLLKSNFPQIEVIMKHQDFLEFALKNNASPFNVERELFDLVIANPPYVRTQVLGQDKSKELSGAFDLSGRVDLYFAFLKGIEMILGEQGIVGIIVSNRFMFTKSGELTRKHILERFTIDHVWDFGDTRLFEAAVLPAVLLLEKGAIHAKNLKAKYTSIYLLDKTINNPQLIFKAIDKKVGTGFTIIDGLLDYGNDLKNVWRIANTESNDWLNMVKKNTRSTFGDLGKIKVGIKTTADSVFIVKNANAFGDKVPETLKPLITHHIARRYKTEAPNRYVIYTHELVNGKKQSINLAKYPNTKTYLERHKAQLSGRSYINDSNRDWYEIWVPHNPDAWKKPKLVFRDISEHPVFWVDLEGYIVNGDCYWLQIDTHENDLMWLAVAVANSNFIEDFYDYSFNNKLYSNRRRFITQYVEKFPLPDPGSSISKKIINLAKKIYSLPIDNSFESIEKQINTLVYQAFGVESKKVSGSGI